MKRKFSESIKYIDTKLLIKTVLWILFCALITVFTILFIIERAQINGQLHTDGLVVGGNTYYSINQIKAAIGSGAINQSLDLVNAYNFMFN
jgi:hypothetical protein